MEIDLNDVLENEYIKMQSEIQEREPLTAHEVEYNNNLERNILSVIAAATPIPDSDKDTISASQKNTPIFKFSSGTGTIDDPYLIKSKEEFSQLSTARNPELYFALIRDIDFSDESITPIGNDETPFSGHLIGNQYTLRNFKIDLKSNKVGLFGYALNAEFKDFTIENGNVNGGNYVANLVGYGKNCVFDGIVLVDSCISKGENTTGGMAGWLQNSTINNCVSEGTVTGAGGYSGGLISFLDSGSIAHSVFFGKVNGNMYAGGVLGGTKAEILYCVNNGAITSNNVAGGVSGVIIYPTAPFKLIKNCFNTGSVSGVSMVGGVAGYAASINNFSLGARIYNVGNTGKIVATKTYAGGIIGNAECTIAVSGAYNTGSISAQTVAGGIFGRLNMQNDYLGALANAYNIGKVAIGTHAGSLIGYNSATGVRTCLYLSEMESGYCSNAIGFNNQTSSSGFYNVLGKTSEEIKNSLDFFDTNIFILDSGDINSGYPILEYVDYNWAKKENDEKNYTYAAILNGWLKIYRRPTYSDVGRAVEMPTVEGFVGSDGHNYEFTNKSHWCVFEPKMSSEYNFINEFAYKEILNKTGQEPVVIEGSKGELIDESEAYWAAIGPKVPFPEQEDNKSILPENVYGNGKVDVVIKNSEGQLFYFPVVIGDTKAHTWTNGIIQTWKAYPDGAFSTAEANYNGVAAVEFIGGTSEVGLNLSNLNNYTIDSLIFYPNLN